MKIWKRIFLYSFILFMIVFNGAGIITIENIHSKNIQVVIKNSLGEGRDIVNTIQLNSDLFHRYEGYALWKKLKNYLHRDSVKERIIEVFNDKNQLVMATSKVKSNIEVNKLEEFTAEEYKFIFTTTNNYEKKISVGHLVKVGEEAFKVVVTNDISYVYSDKLSNYKIFLGLSAMATVVLSLGLYIISKKITKPIENLTLVSNSIRDGDYTKRADYKKSDEIGILSKNFNSMMEEIQLNVEELKKLNDSKQRFIDNLTHEMKTPITSILGYSELLLKGNLNEELKAKSLMNINMQGKRLENLNLSLVRLIMAKKTEVTFLKLDVNELIGRVILNTEYRVHEKEIIITRDIKKGKIIGEKDLIDTMITNLIENAIKASRKKSKIAIIGKPIKKEQRYELIIKDWGIGMEEWEVKRIMEPFYMIDTVRNTKGKNMGLGLALCKEIGEINDIKINIKSKINEGTEIILKLKMEAI